MRRSLVLPALLVAGLTVLPACRSMGTGAGSGAVIGTAVGTGAGYAIGRHNDRTWAGAGIGALAGGLLGAAIGDSVDTDHQRDIDGPTVYRTEHAQAPRMEEPYRGPARVIRRAPAPAPATHERIIIRDVYPDGTVRERTVILD